MYQLSFFFAAAMVACSSISFAQCKPCEPCKPCCFFEQGLALPDDQKPPCDVKYAPAYNAAAGTRVDCSWNFNINAAFIYWDWSQDGMDVTYVEPMLGFIPGSVVHQDTGYTPGFKIGIGVDTRFDNWIFNAEYTWFHPSQDGTAKSIDGFSANNWFAPSRPADNFYDTVSSIWGMHLDMIDITASRPYYEGTHLTIAPIGGMRVLSLHEGIHVTMTDPFFDVDPIVSSSNHSHAWAVGPMAGVNSKWIVWKGLRFDGVIGSSLLYTRYTEIVNSQTVVGVGTVSSSVSNISAIRPTFDMGLGLGYGSYLFKNRFFVDLSARYDFIQFWSQNMIRNFASQLAGRDNAIGDLHMHGLTLNLRCDF